MFDLPGPIGTFVNFLIIALGFGFIIFIHELGHFVAAKWAGIRVLAFSIGFGNVLCSYRKGVGFRRGSSEPEYRKRMYDAGPDGEAKVHQEISPTEYRLSMLPLGGYVKMLGQEDLNPLAVSDAPDSYQNCSAQKRMVVISAGVIMNIISAAILFIIVFMVGLRVFPAIVGFVPEDSPAANAIAINHPELEHGLQRGDRILSINGNVTHSYEGILPEIAMSKKGSPARIQVERDGVDGIIEFEAIPIKSEQSGLLDLGIIPSISTSLKGAKDEQSQRIWEMSSYDYGFTGLKPNDRFVSANGSPIRSPFDLLDLASVSNGQPIAATVDRNGQSVDFTLNPVRSMQTDLVQMGDAQQGIRHILGLTGVLMVHPHASPVDTQQGLQPGDIFARIGNIDFPSHLQGITAIRENTGKSLDLVVLREDDTGADQRVKLTVKVTPEGSIGFYQSTTTSHSNRVSMPPSFMQPRADDPDSFAAVVSLASSLIEYPGSRIVRVGDTQIESLRDLPDAIVRATQSRFDAGEQSFSISVVLELPLPVQPDGSIPTSTLDWNLSRVDIEQVRALGWTLPMDTDTMTMFDFAQIVDKAGSPFSAISRGIHESRRVMLQTYLTFLRLFEGSVQVKHLKGPVGIAHLGTQIASQGWVWVLFFMALISINLAVINFLPLPIVDGGQFLMLVYEWIRKKPVPIVIQNTATMAGLLLIGMIFLYVTFNDVKAIFGL